MYLPLKQDEGNYLSEEEDPNQNTIRIAQVTTRRIFIFSHILLLGTYAIGLWFVSHWQPNDESCIVKQSTYCKFLSPYGSKSG